MAIDHKRPLPVPPERLAHLAPMLFGRSYAHLGWTERRELFKLAMQAEQVEEQRQTNFYLEEAYQIYNGRFR